MARIDGIVSGFDTEALVKASVSSYQSQIDRLNKKNTLLSWQKTKYTEIYKKIETFRNKAFNYKLDSTLKPKVATSADTSKVKVTASANAATGIHTINVTQLAEGAQTGSQKALGSTNNKKSLETQFASNTAFQSLGATSFNIDINGKTIAVDTNKSIYELVNNINKAGAGVTASYDASLDRMFITADGTGSNAKIDFSANTSGSVADVFLANVLQFNDGVDVAVTLPNGATDTLPSLMAPVVGKDAIFELNGVTGITQSTNTFEVSGITYELQAVGNTTVQVTNDSDALFNSIKTFVDDYNALLDDINAIIYEQKYKGFGPLTDDEKSAMTESQIKDWEEKAKSGILSRDPILMNLVTSMRTAIYTPVEGVNSKYNGLFSIGLKTGDYQTNGKVIIDEDKLKAAIAADPDSVAKIFNGGTDRNGKKTSGVADTLYDNLKAGMDKINSQAGVATGSNDINSTIAKEVTRNTKAINSKIATMNLKMDMYYKKYDAMEQLLQKLQTQQSSLASYFNSN